MDPYGKRVLARLKKKGHILDIAEGAIRDIFEALCDELIFEVGNNKTKWDDYMVKPIEFTKSLGLKLIDKINGKQDA